MSKTEALVGHVRAGTHKIDGLIVYRKTSTGEWVRSTLWRKDVVRRAAVAMM